VGERRASGLGREEGEGEREGRLKIFFQKEGGRMGGRWYSASVGVNEGCGMERWTSVRQTSIWVAALGFAGDILQLKLELEFSG